MRDKRRDDLTNIAYIDTGLTGSGIAVWDPANWEEQDAPRIPYWVGVVTPRESGQGWMAKVDEVVSAIAGILDETYVDTIVMELPEYWQSDERGQTAVVRGDFTKLCYFCGSLGRACYYLAIDVVTVSPADWKGQLPKSVVTTRISKLYEKYGLLDDFAALNVQSHAIDAIGIGLWRQGRLNR